MFPGGRGFWRWFIALAGRFGCRGGEAGNLWKSDHLSCCPPAPPAPKMQLCHPGLCCRGCWFLGSISPGLGAPLSNKCNENEQRPCRDAGHHFLWRNGPFPPQLHQPAEGTGTVQHSKPSTLATSPQGRAEPSSAPTPPNGQKTPQKESSKKKTFPKQGSLATSSRGEGGVGGELKLSSLPGKSVALSLWAAKKFLK